jgi:uncharacterized protein (DUF2062 family)
MVFKRRNRRSFSERAAGWVYPPGGWGRAARYVGYRLRRLPDPAHKIARGIGCGVFVCFTPLYGLHFLMSAGLAWIIGGNVLAALLSTFFGNPITFPVIATISVELGSWILGREPVPLPQIVSSFSFASVEIWSNLAAIFTDDAMEWGQLSTFFEAVFWPYMVGGLGPGLLAGLLAYCFSYPLIHAYQRARIARLQRKIAKIRAAKDRADRAAGAR